MTASRLEGFHFDPDVAQIPVLMPLQLFQPLYPVFTFLQLHQIDEIAHSKPLGAEKRNRHKRSGGDLRENPRLPCHVSELIGLLDDLRMDIGDRYGFVRSADFGPDRQKEKNDEAKNQSSFDKDTANACCEHFGARSPIS
jgi:hypothetical protein